MARIARGQDVLIKAQELLSKATTANDLRTLQAVILPLTNGMSTLETAKVIGRSPRWTTKVRNEFIRNAGMNGKIHKKFRNRAYMTKNDEEAFLNTFFEKARQSGILIVNEIHKALERHLGCKVALSSAYNLLHRNGWRKLTPYKRHTKADKQAQEEWKKNSQPSLRKSRKNGT
jgi:transposase